MANIIDWLGVETEYRANLQSLRKMATEFGTSEGTIRRRARQYGWVRDGSMVKRERVKAHFAGKPAAEVANQPQAVVKAIDAAAIEDIKDMGTGLENARLALEIANKALKRLDEEKQYLHLIVQDARNLKVLTETNRHNVEVIRRIRGLDDPATNDRIPLSEVDDVIIERYLHARTQ